MRLTEALVRPMFARAIASHRVPALNAAFHKHLGLENTFAEVQSDQGSGKVWKPVSFKAFECHHFTQQAITRILHQVWPDDEARAAKPAAGAQSSATQSGETKRKRQSIKKQLDSEWGMLGAQQQLEYKRQYIQLWGLFEIVMGQMRCRDPTRPDLVDFGRNCRSLGARWCMLMPKNRCGALYLHTLMMHGGAFMEHLLPLKLTIGMLENSGAERRHQIGKVHFRKSLAGGGKQYSGMTAHQNRSAYLTIRGVLIWQYGRDLVALEEMKLAEAPTPDRPTCRGRNQAGWANQLNRSSTQGRRAAPEPEEMDLGVSDFPSDARLQALEREDTAVDLVQDLMAADPTLATAMDDEGGLQVQGGEYHVRVDGQPTDSSGQSGSGDDSSDNDHEPMSESDWA